MKVIRRNLRKANWLDYLLMYLFVFCASAGAALFIVMRVFTYGASYTIVGSLSNDDWHQIALGVKWVLGLAGIVGMLALYLFLRRLRNEDAVDGHSVPDDES